MQQWVTEMAAHVKSIDSEHLLEIGLEGFYGETTPDKKQYNPGNLEFGSDFIATNLLPQIDFATIHIYADQWYVQNLYLLSYVYMYSLICPIYSKHITRKPQKRLRMI